MDNLWLDRSLSFYKFIFVLKQDLDDTFIERHTRKEIAYALRRLYPYNRWGINMCKKRGIGHILSWYMVHGYGVTYDEKAISKNKFTYRMAAIQERYGDDEEEAHGQMDDLMCEVLTSLGYDDGVSIFKSQNKWYS